MSLVPSFILTSRRREDQVFLSDLAVALVVILMFVLATQHLKQVELRAEVVSTVAQVENLAGAREELVETLSKARERIAALEKDIKSAGKEKGTLVALQNKLEEEIKTRDGRIEKLEVELTRAKASGDLAGLEIQRLGQELEKSLLNLKEVQKELEGVKTDLITANQTIADLKTEAKALRADRDKLSDDLKALRNSAPALKQARDVFEREAKAAFQNERMVSVGPQGITIPSILIYSPTTNAPLANGEGLLKKVVDVYFKTLPQLDRKLGNMVLNFQVHGHPEPVVDQLVRPLSSRDQTDSQMIILNQTLSNLGVPAGTYTLQSMGDISPADDRGDEFSATTNRRVVIHILQSTSPVTLQGQ